MTSRLTIRMLALLILVLAGCGDDGDRTIDATLDELWPDADGLAWTYDVSVTTSESSLGLLSDPEDSLPSIRRLYSIFDGFAHTGRTTTAQDELTTRFDGQVTTTSGVTGRHLVSTWANPIDSAPASFLALLRRARPDLRNRLPAPDKLSERDQPYGVTGYCWEKTETQIRGYGDASVDVSWLYLAAPLAVGATFDLQLVPYLADDIWLHGMIVRQLTWTQSGTSYPRAVEVFTVVDFGVQEITNAEGLVMGRHHSFLCYRTIFAPGVGPVYTHEWRSMAGDEVLADPEPATMEIETVLTATAEPE